MGSLFYYGGNVKSKALLIPYFTHQECTEGRRLIDFSALNCNRNSCDMRLFLDHNLQWNVGMWSTFLWDQSFIPRADWLLDSIANEPFSRQVDNMCRLQTRGRSHFHFIVLGQDCEGTHDGAPKVDEGDRRWSRDQAGKRRPGGPARVAELFIPQLAPLTS